MRPIEIGRGGFLRYLLLPHGAKMQRLSPASHARLDTINRTANASHYSGAGAIEYDRAHRYAEAEQHEYPAAALVETVWAPGGYGRVLELGSGTGYFTVRLARRAECVVAVEPVPDMQKVLRERCRAEGVSNVEILDAPAAALGTRVARGSMDSAVIVQALHHFHRRPEVFAALGAAVRPGGRLYLLEPHHNARRVARLLRKWVTTYRRPAYWRDERKWATHDFLTCGDVRALCRHGGFTDVRIHGYWLPLFRRLVPDGPRRFALERRLGRVPGLRHLSLVLAVEARRVV